MVRHLRGVGDPLWKRLTAPLKHVRKLVSAVAFF
jgi:hypothetical protein